ncbi:anaerobic C4-dicarboxylate transporter [Salmonella enterica subsp. enterica serovar Goldcoast]|nr:anaerobic C4-dicarboxylate transporter [Salmonella enterica subsp. enterica serovar Goldcoast]
MLFSIQLLIILICLFYGARKGGIALGLLGGIVWSFWCLFSISSQVNRPLT